MQSLKLAGLTALLCAGIALAQSPQSQKPVSSGSSSSSSSGDAAPASPPKAPDDGKVAQTPPSPPIRVNVNEVIVPVTVTDAQGKFVSDLDKKDFQVFE